MDASVQRDQKARQTRLLQNDPVRDDVVAYLAEVQKPGGQGQHLDGRQGIPEVVRPVQIRDRQQRQGETADGDPR